MKIDTIKAGEKALVDVFCDKYRFSIPPYQRPYAWQTEQAGELFDDLLIAVGEGSIAERPPYFLGSVVLIKDPNAPDADVVDGQQRLTTLTILLAVLRDQMEGKAQDAAHRYICEEGDEFAGSQERFRLRLRDRDADFFEDTIQQPGRTMALPNLDTTVEGPRNRMVDNAAFLTKQVAELDEEVCKRLVTFMIQKCYLVMVEASDAESAYRVFSVMNDRGLDLSPTDILKADIIGAMPETDREPYTEVWEDIEDKLGRDAFKDLFGHIRMIHRRQKMARTLEAEVRQFVKPAAEPKGFIDKTLKPLAEAFGALRTQGFESAAHADTINQRLRWLSMLDNVDWEAPVIHFMSQPENDPAALAHFLTAMDGLAYCLFINRANINVRIQRYGRLITMIETGGDLWDDNSPLRLTTEEKNGALAQLEGPLYQIVRIRLPVLLRLDEALSDGTASYQHKTISVEHVLPQNPPSNSVWMSWFPDQEERLAWTHRLANLVLLARFKNSQAQNYDFNRKKKEYFQRKGTSPFAITSQVLDTEEWTPGVLETRQKKLVGALTNLWSLG